MLADEVFKYHVPPIRRLPPSLWTRLRNDLGNKSYLLGNWNRKSELILFCNLLVYHVLFLSEAYSEWSKQTFIIKKRCSAFRCQPIKTIGVEETESSRKRFLREISLTNVLNTLKLIQSKMHDSFLQVNHRREKHIHTLSLSGSYFYRLSINTRKKKTCFSASEVSHFLIHWR